MHFEKLDNIAKEAMALFTMFRFCEGKEATIMLRKREVYKLPARQPRPRKNK